MKKTSKRSKNSKTSSRKQNLYEEQTSDETFYFIAGFTEGGVPYGTTWEEIISEELKVRIAVKEDAESATELIHIAIGDIAEQLTGQTKAENIRKTLASFFREENNRLSYQNTLIADINGEIAGIVITYSGNDATQLDEPIVNRLRKKKGNQNLHFDQEVDDGDYYIDTLCVHTNFQGYGIGARLIKEAEKTAILKGYHRIAINVSHNNPLAKRLYKKLGYIEEKVIQINGHDYDYMVKS